MIELCLVAHIKQYVKITTPFRNTGKSKLLLSFAQPHKPVLTTTLSRWFVTLMKEPEINVKIFGSYSTRSASTSKYKISGLSFKEFAESAGCSNGKTFPQFYDRLTQEDF